MTHQPQHLTAILAVGIAILSTGCHSADDGKLLFRPDLNAPRSVHTSDNTTTKMKLNGRDITFGNVREATYSMTPTAVTDDGTVTLDVVYDSVHEEMSAPEGLPGGDAPGIDDLFGNKSKQEALDVLKGERFTIRVSCLGEVLSVDGADACADKAVDAYKAPGHIPGEQVKQQIRHGLDNAAMKQQMRRVFLNVPDKALKPGDAWRNNSEFEGLPMPTKVESTNTLEKREDGIATIDTDYAYTVEMSKSPTGGASNPNPKNAAITGKGSGTAEYEEATGWVRTSVSTMTASGTAAAKGGASSPIEVSGKMETTSRPAS